MTCIVQGTTCPLVYMQRCLLGDPDKVSVHAQASALRLHGCALVFTLLKIQASSHVHIHELYSAEYRCISEVCAPCICVGQRRMYMCITKMTRTGENLLINFTSLVCSAFFALRCVLCCPGTSECVSLRLAPECSALPRRKQNNRMSQPELQDFSFKVAPSF